MIDDDRVRILSRSDVRAILAWPQVFDAVEDALRAVTAPSTVASISSQLVVPGASLHLKAGAMLASSSVTVKANLRPNDGRASGAILLFDSTLQRLTAVIASADLTAMRTAAVAAVAARQLARNATATVTILGSGPVARFTDEALTLLSIPSRVRVWSRSPERARQFAASGTGSVEYSAHDTVADAVEGADLIVTCTPAHSPILSLEHLRQPVVVLAMGADSKGKRELAPGLIESSTVYADVVKDALLVGESAYLDPAEAGRIIEFGQILKRGNDEPATERDLVVFDSVGSSVVDAAVVALLTGPIGEQHGLQVNLNA